ncbi:hypothetical protein [Nitrosomonas supralitoralis]|uniref:Uncharacterized protein n=1 Tax=Nitrosomonas supralitoralis TaxID=2116706 RepID=A0A2P7NXG5_9PROT|nr:hypothetical protein [Nitrosomonas supralitoralis]PSJ18156.1 hypothetical protein C7H79_04725 [Nitrosomonas supralitoralis]
MDKHITSYAKEITLESDKANSLDMRDGISNEFNNNSNPFIIQENIGRTEEGKQKGGRGEEGIQSREVFNLMATNEPRIEANEKRIDDLMERYNHLKVESTEIHREQPMKQFDDRESLKEQRLEQLKERYDNQEKKLEERPHLDNGYSL